MTQPVARVNAGNSPEGVAVTPDGSKVYVANSGNISVSELTFQVTQQKYQIQIFIVISKAF